MRLVDADGKDPRRPHGQRLRRGGALRGRHPDPPLLGIHRPLERRSARGAGAFRSIAIEGPDEEFLIAAALGEPGSEGHGAERASGWLLEGEDATPFEEALISTQYDAAGEPTRFGLELWPEDADQIEPRRGDASLRVLARRRGAGGTWAGLFRCHTDGTEGLGSYLLWRA